MPLIKFLLVDDYEPIVTSFALLFSRDERVLIKRCRSKEEVLAEIDKHPNLVAVFLDNDLGHGNDGLEVARELVENKTTLSLFSISSVRSSEMEELGVIHIDKTPQAVRKVIEEFHLRAVGF